MALENNRSESVDILNRKTGDLVTQYSGPGDRVVNITQSSVVRINASPESVNYYQRQGDDLIVHMRDGSTVRYQNFFHLDAEGLHSELIFEDQYGTHHAVFPFATEAGPAAAEAVVPVMADTSLGTLIGGEGLSTAAILGGLAAVAGIAGVAIAASGGGGGGGGGSDNDNGNGGGNGNGDGDGGSGGGEDGGTGGGDGTNPGGGDDGTNPGGDDDGTNPGGGDDGTNPGSGDDGTNPGGGDDGTNPGGETPAPSTLIVAPLAEDNVINLIESTTDQILSGSTDASNAGRTITVTLGINSWNAVIAADGSWTVIIPGGVLQALPQGEINLNVSFVDSNGNTVAEDIALTVDTIPPELELAEFSPGNVLDQAQIDSGKLISGFSSPEDAGQTVTIMLGNNQFQAIIAEDGSWSALIPSEILQTLQEEQVYTLEISVTDLAGNTATAEQSFIVNTTDPIIQLDPFTGDNQINGAEIALNQILTGWTANIEPGQLVAVTLGAHAYFTRVAGDGSFQVTVPAGDLQALAPPVETIIVQCQNNDGTLLAQTTETLVIDLSQDAIAIAILSTDDYLNAAESTQPLEVRGVTTVTGPGVAVTVNFNGKDYAALVDGAGNWSAVIPPEDLALLPDGVTPVTATVTYGIESASDARDLNVAVNYLPKPTLETPFGDGFLNAQEITTNQTLSGSTGITGTGQQVTVQLGDKSYIAIVDVDGRWSLEVPAADLQSLREGTVSLNVNAIDAAGNSATLASNAIVDVTPPILSLLPFSGDGKLSAAELSAAQTLSGITTPEQNGREVVVDINNQRFTTTVNSDGTWSVALPAGSLSSLIAGNTNYTVTLTDSAGNSQQAIGTVAVKTAQPLLSVDPFTANNALSAAEVKTDQWLTGSTDNVEAGSKIVVVLGNQEFTTQVDADGNWRIQMTAADLQKLADGTNTLQVSVTDAFGQSASQQHSFVVDKSLSAVAISIIADDDYLNQAESTEDLVVRGTSAGLPAGTPIEVSFGGTLFNTTIAPDGSWSITVGAEVLADLSDGELTITATATSPDNIPVSDTHQLNVLVENLPLPTLDAPFGDGILNLAERGQSHEITGSTGITGGGQQVEITLNGNTYRGQVAADGTWSVSLPAGALTGLTDAASPVALVVTVTDAAGNVVPINESFTVDVTPPTVTVLPFTGDDILNVAEAGVQQTLSGFAPGAEGGQPVTIVINGVTYQTITGSLGGWELPIPAQDLQALPSGPIAVTVTATDGAGNATTITHLITVDTDPQQQPRVVIDPVTTNNILDAGEVLADVTITGYTLNVEAGREVTVTINGESWTGFVDAAGRWSVAVPQAAIGALADGEQTLTVTVTDAAGNAASADRTFTVNLDTSSLTLDPITGDNILGVADLADGFTITGNSVNLTEGTVLTVTLNGKQYPATVTAGGTWSALVPQADAAALADGTATLTVSGIDADGNPISTAHSFNVLTHQTPEPTLNTPFTDGIVSGSELSGGALSGTTGVNGAGQTVTVTLGTATLTATVDANGNWSVAVPGTALADLAEGPNALVVTATDAAGNSNTLESSLQVDTTPPTLTIAPIAGDNIVNIAEAKQEIVISGTAGPFDPERAQYVIVDLNGQKYSALIQEGNIWSATIPANALSNLPDGPVTVTVTASDAVGNSTTETATLTLNTDPLSAPTLTLDPVSGDDYINATEAQDLVTLSGTTTFVETGREVVLTLNGVEYRAPVLADGSWTVDVLATDLALVADGPQVITATVTDTAGNPASTTRTVNFIASPDNQPSLTVDVVAGDDVINAQEQDLPLIVTGGSRNLPQGTLVNITLGDGNYTATIGPDGKWQATIQPADLQALADQGYNLVVTALDPALNEATISYPITVDTSGPDVIINETGFYLDGRLNLAEAGADQLLTGTTAAGSTVSLTLNGNTITTQAGIDGSWQLTLPSQDLKALDQGPNALEVVVTDPQGNETREPLPLDVGTVLPTLTLNAVFDDNLVNIDEADAGGEITGTATGLADGTEVAIYLGETQLGTGIVTGGVWSVTIDTGEFNNFASGQYVLTAEAVDAYGNPASTSANIELLLTELQATLPDELFTDGYLNQAEASVGQTLTGTTGISGSGQSVVVNIEGLAPIAGTVDDQGNWTVQLPADLLQNLVDGAYDVTVTVTDKAGNTNTSPVETFEVRTDALPVPTLTPPFTDGTLNSDEADAGGALGGTTGLAAEDIAQVTVSINNGPAQIATVNPDGSWTLPLTPEQLNALPDGTLPVTVVVTDVAGNTSPGNSSFGVVINTVPVATFMTPFGDGVLNYAETQTPQVIRGSTGVTGAGQTVTLTFNGEDYLGTVNERGEWSVTLPTTAFAGLATGTTPTMTVEVTDAALNSDTADLTYQVQTALPTPAITSLFGDDDFLNIAEAAGPLTLTGTTGVTGPNQYVTVTIDVDGARYVATVTPEGTWSVPLPAGALQSLENGPHSITVIAQDQYGNQTPLDVPFTAALTPPTVTINTPIFTDGYVNVAESDGTTQLSGALTTGVPEDTTVIVTIGGVPFTADVSGNSWTLNLGPNSLDGVPNGPQSVVVTITDGADNTGSTTVPVNIAIVPPTITVALPFEDGALSFAESQQIQTISGTTTNVEAGQTVTVTLGNQQYTTTVQPGGGWSLQLTPQQMALLTQGDTTITAAVSDRAQNPATSEPIDVAINTQPPEYSVTINPPGTDGYLNASELSGETVAISGRTTGFAAGQEVTITVNGVEVGNAVIDANGDWTLDVPSAVFAAQTDYTVIGTTVAEPVTTGNTSVIVDTTPPTITINAISGDDVISASESNQPLIITGTAVGEQGRTVTVTLNGQTLYSTVDSAGNWSVTLTPAQVAALPNGTLDVTASMTDVAGNPDSEVRPITVDKDAPLLVVDTLGVPALLTTATAIPGVLLGGQGDPGETVTVRVGPLIAEALVGPDGRWTINSTDLDLTTLFDGAQVISITSTDAAGNTSTNNVALNVALNRGLGVLVEDLIGGDGILNVAESLLTQTLTGTITGDYRGATVEATLIGTDITLPVVAVGPDGRFAIDFPPELWSQILTDTVSLQLNVTDANGNTTNEIIDVRLALSDLPVIGDVIAAGDNIINVLDSTTDQLVTGTLSTVENVAGVAVTLAGNTYQAVLNGTQWAVTLPQAVLAALPDGTAALQVAVSDTFGNVVSDTISLTVALRNLPTLALDPLFGDGTLSIPDLLSGLVSGTATGLAGQTLNISIGNAPLLTTTVGADGRWSVALTPEVRDILQTVGSGTVPVSITATDQNGNVADVENTLRLDLLQPVLNTLTTFGDGLLNAVDALATQTITGVVGNAPAGSSVSVDIGGRTFAGVVASNGAFTINVGPAQLALLSDGVFTPTVTITTPNGNTSQVPGTSPITIGLTNLPTVVVDTVFGDGLLNALETGVAQTISGTVGNLASGTVLVRIGNAAPLEATINNGVWSVQVQPDVLRLLPDGALNVTATVQDAAGNVATGNKVLNSIINAVPTLTVNTPFGDGNLSLTDLLTNQILSGSSTNLAAGTQVTVNVGPLALSTTIAADGSWQLSLPGTVLQGLQDGSQLISVTAQDAVGNLAQGTQNLLVSIAALPSIILDPLFGDGGLNATDILSAKVITGSSSNAIGAQVNLTLGSKTYQTTVGADGRWSIPVSQTDLGQLLDGTLTVNASLTNAAGNSANTSGLLNVVTSLLPTISLTSLFGNDNYLNVSEASSGQILSGRITGSGSGASVVVTLGNTPYNATVNPDGTWSLALSSNVLSGLANGALKVGVAVTDSVGNVNRTSTDVTVKLTTPELTFNALQSLNLLTLLSKGLTLNGGSRNLGPGAVVHLSLLNNTVTTTAITDANGNWSANLGLGLNILQLLSLSSVLTIYSTDVAGNTGYLNVGLGGNIISTEPPAGFTVTQADAETFSLLAATAEVQQEPAETQEQQTATSMQDDAARFAEPQTTTDSELSSFTIGGVSIDLADGTYQSGETLQGSEGNDTIHLSTLGFTSIDAGAGTDTLMLDGINMTLDLTALTGKLHNIEIFDLGQSGTNAITLDLNEALTITDKPEDDLLIKGSNGDQVNLVKGQGDIWQVSGQREVDGVQFDVYHNSSQTNTLGDVLVQHGLHVNVV
ncbi:Ig-like domain-containing protein [Atlantibacter subterranea]|uniref:Ig-like domain-containing protein n=1 Tax=Atlantibacter subterraneus TaxID=255519 RepID=UPI0011846154|nr:Ig-like domain-containing protein [Atlantibacter subterranea]TSJ56802.1 Ig-like domain-containing protein [Atlantibacter subterranea]